MTSVALTAWSRCLTQCACMQRHGPFFSLYCDVCTSRAMRPRAGHGSLSCLQVVDRGGGVTQLDLESAAYTVQASMSSIANSWQRGQRDDWSCASKLLVWSVMGFK
jgi:hypothetical protein